MRTSGVDNLWLFVIDVFFLSQCMYNNIESMIAQGCRDGSERLEFNINSSECICV